MTTGNATQGWPFLIARGRRRGYSVLLAPAFLVDQHDYGFLEEATGPLHPGEPFRITTTSRAGRPLCLVWTEHPVSAADIGSDGEPPRDEHSRPLRWINGFLCAGSTVSHPSEIDIASARTAARDTYRRFLANEERFRTERSAPLPLHSTLAGLTPRQPAAPARPGRPRGLIILASATAVAAAGAIALSGSPSPQPSSCPLPTMTTTPAPTTTRIRPTTRLPPPPLTSTTQPAAPTSSCKPV